MKLLKKLALVAALSTAAVAASAMEPIADADLSAVSGQDGVSIAADLHINMGSFTYTNTTDNNASVSFKNVAINGTFATTLDVISGTSFTADVFSPSVLGVTAVTAGNAATQGAALAGFYAGGDVVKIAIPKIAVEAGHELNFSVGAIQMGGSTKSFGAMAMNDIKLQGTTAYIWAH
jgi:hypothetical protein